MTAQLSQFARSLSVETAFTVLAVAKSLKAAGKDVVELEIGDSPFDSTASAKAAGVQAIEQNQSHYCPRRGFPNSARPPRDSSNASSTSRPRRKISSPDRGPRSSSSFSARRFSIRAMACSSSVPIFRPICRTSNAAGAGRRATAVAIEPIPA